MAERNNNNFENISPQRNKSDNVQKRNNSDEQWKTIRHLREIEDMMAKRMTQINESVLDFNNQEIILQSSGKSLKKDNNSKLSRRKFLKLGALTTIGTALGVYGLKRAVDYFGEDEDKEEEVLDKSGQSQGKDERLIYRSPSGNEQKKQEIIKEKEAKLLRDIFVEQVIQDKKINLNMEVKNSIGLYWEREHSKKGRERLGLETALKRMKGWYREVKGEFLAVYDEEKLSKYGVSKEDFLKLIYLAIPESYCRQTAGSSAGAVGWYQLIKGTATGKNSKGQQVEKGLGLIVDKNIDERYDIISNARGAALYLVRLYKKFKIENQATDEDAWKLTLARYNGGKYIRSFKGNTYEEFLKEREQVLNEYIAQVLQQGYFESYKVQKIYDKRRRKRRYETLEEVAKRLGVNLEELKHLNRDSIGTKKGNKLKIPIFRKSFEYKVVSGDTLWRIAHRYNISIEQIKEDNKMNTDNIKPGQMLKVNIDDVDGSRFKNSLELLFKVDLHSALENLNYPEKFFAILNVLEKDGLVLSDKDDQIKKQYKTGLDLKKKFKKSMSLVDLSLMLNISFQALSSINRHILNSRKKIPANVRVYFPQGIDLDTQLKISTTNKKVKKISPRKHKIKK